MNNTNLSILIVDDEQLARERLKRLISRCKGYEVIAEAENGLRAIEMMARHAPDIILLDIRMPGADGLEVARNTLDLDSAPAIIFCTAYDEYAIKAFEFNACAYLLKPAREEDLQKALKQATKLTQAQLTALKKKQSDSEEHLNFVAHTWQGLEKIAFEDIFYFQADHKYVTIHHKAGETLTDHTLKEIEQKFPEEVFRCHRNCVVNKHHIKALHRDNTSRYTLELSEKHHVPVSRRMVSETKTLLDSL